jgi:hypothetical protein
MILVHHTQEILYILVISMWGHTGTNWEYIGNQIALQQPMTQSQCEYLIDKDMWETSYDNKYYQLRAHCFPENCAGKESCD